LGTSNTVVPSQNAVKTYVDNHTSTTSDDSKLDCIRPIVLPATSNYTIAN